MKLKFSLLFLHFLVVNCCICQVERGSFAFTPGENSLFETYLNEEVIYGRHQEISTPIIDYFLTKNLSVGLQFQRAGNRFFDYTNFGIGTDREISLSLLQPHLKYGVYHRYFGIFLSYRYHFLNIKDNFERETGKQHATFAGLGGQLRLTPNLAFNCWFEAPHLQKATVFPKEDYRLSIGLQYHFNNNDRPFVGLNLADYYFSKSNIRLSGGYEIGSRFQSEENEEKVLFGAFNLTVQYSLRDYFDFYFTYLSTYAQDCDFSEQSANNAAIRFGFIITFPLSDNFYWNWKAGGVYTERNVGFSYSNKRGFDFGSTFQFFFQKRCILKTGLDVEVFPRFNDASDLVVQPFISAEIFGGRNLSIEPKILYDYSRIYNRFFGETDTFKQLRFELNFRTLFAINWKRFGTK